MLHRFLSPEQAPFFLIGVGHLLFELSVYDSIVIHDNQQHINPHSTYDPYRVIRALVPQR